MQQLFNLNISNKDGTIYVDLQLGVANFVKKLTDDVKEILNG